MIIILIERKRSIGGDETVVRSRAAYAILCFTMTTITMLLRIIIYIERIYY